LMMMLSMTSLHLSVRFVKKILSSHGFDHCVILTW
jgi:hypothetical protein